MTLQEERVAMSIRLRQELYEQLRLAAFNGKTSMSRIIAYALADYFDRKQAADDLPV